ncbi:MAG: hypothetical protein WHF31_15180 [Candidatus Dehalobacter alkaniphilus]
MAIRSGFFNSVGGDRLYDASRFAEYFASFIGSGVFPDPTTSLQIQADTGMNIKVKSGKAWISGYILINDADYTDAIPTEAVLNRIDRMVVRLHYANRTITIVRKAGTAASSPTAPAVTRDANMYEISLATIQINAGTSAITSGMITDTRSDSIVCGFVSSTITNIPYMTPNRALVSDIDGELAVSSVTDAELGYLSGVTGAIQAQINGKQATITGAASTIVSSNLTANRALVANGSGKVAVSTVTDAELGYLSGVTSAIQTQINSKQATITGGASTIVSGNLDTNKAIVSDSNGKVAVSAVTAAELGYLSGVTSSVQTQLNNKLGSTSQAADSLKVGGKKVTVGTSAPSSPAVGDVWIDTN